MAQQLKWQLGKVLEIRQETPTVKSLILEVPDWTTHLAGQQRGLRHNETFWSSDVVPARNGRNPALR